jgi:hypothetical protein
MSTLKKLHDWLGQIAEEPPPHPLVSVLAGIVFLILVSALL